MSQSFNQMTTSLREANEKMQQQADTLQEQAKALLTSNRDLEEKSQTLTAQKAGLSESSVKKVESGTARISFSAYLALLDLYGVAQGLDRLLADGDDPIGEALARGNLRQRAREPGKASGNDDEWAF